jgi:nitrile hydratase subunit beta
MAVIEAKDVPALIRRGAPANVDVASQARFSVGDVVTTILANPLNHTRLPRYARGKQGVVVADHGVFIFPDAHAHLQGKQPQHLYSVKFNQADLWGPTANPRDSLYLDLFEDYLLAVGAVT